MRKQEDLKLGDVDVSVLFITYNRSDLLEIAFQSIREQMDFGSLRVEYVVSDDATDAPNHLKILSMPFDKFVIAERNMGLGNNQNKGIAATSGRYILQIQDDLEFIGDKALVLTALEILESDHDIGIIQLINQTPSVPHEVRYLENGTRYLVFENDRIPQIRDSGARPYSDQPHLKRRQFCEDIGPYKEGIHMTIMELTYQKEVANQNRWRVASMSQSSSFNHLGAERSFNPCHLRARRLEKIEHFHFVGPFFKRLRPKIRKVRDWIRERRK